MEPAPVSFPQEIGKDLDSSGVNRLSCTRVGAAPGGFSSSRRLAARPAGRSHEEEKTDENVAAPAAVDAFNPANVKATKAGTATLTFTDANNGTFNYVIGAVNQTKAITREAFGTIRHLHVRHRRRPDDGHQLPGSLVEQAGELGIGMGDQPQP